MKPSDSSSEEPTEFHVVGSAEQAAILSDTAAMRYFEPFLAWESSASAAAAKAGVRLDTLLYRVRRFLAAGLLRVVREERRAGRPIKVYRSSADAYFVPFAITPYADLAERLKEETGDFIAHSYAAMAGVLAAQGADGRRLYRKADGTVWQDMADASLRKFSVKEGRPGIAEAFMGRPRLRESDARALCADIEALFYKALDLHDESEGKPFLMTLIFAPERAG